MTATKEVRRVRSLKVEAAYGRLYVSGPLSFHARHLPGAALNKKRSERVGQSVYELSLTLNTLRELKRALNMTGRELAAHCDEGVMRWARAAHASDNEIRAIHQRMADGFREEFPWLDRRAGRIAPEGTPDAQVERDSEGVLRWKYRAPYAHQEVMATMASHASGVAFLCEMGTGKTRAALEAASHKVRTGQLDGIIVVCPNSVTGTWERESKVWANHFTPARLDGSVVGRIKALKALFRRRDLNPLVVLNFEVLDKMKAAILKAAERSRIGIIFDEGHRVRNPGAKVTKAAMKISAHLPWRILMTGTPIVNGVQNIWSQWYVTDLGVTFGANFRQFRREFFEEDPERFSIDPLEGTISEINKRIRVRGIRYTKAECLDLPPKVYQTLEASMSREQAQAYEEMKETLVVEFERLEDEAEGQATAAIQLTMLLRLAQITSGYLPNEEGGAGAIYRFPSIPKLDLLTEQVNEVMGAGKQVIIWAAFRENYNMIEERVGHHGLVKIVGGMTQKTRDQAELDFQAGAARILLGHPASASLGLNLQAADTAMYYSQGYNLDYRLQSEDRCHRSGSEIHNRVTYLDFQCRGTIDEVISASLAGKLSVAEAVTEFRRQIDV